ncbi:restriction endonuclease subunit S [Aeromonas caviae]|uniref:restriction endonuclease subunit S n=1 Tax=Aeromonas caviae TaxID=648 RepID=UPI000F5D7F8A|nr:restriction endonuclease subunit S [Aeromonas caviae]RQX21676.1 restriction endonuclease subunit S [Aeromonas caviae]
MSTMNQLGKYQPYQQYEFIDVPWYKQKPTHWLSVKFKHSFNEKRKVNNPNLPAGAISFGEVIYKDEGKLSQDTKDSYQEVLAGEFLINPLNLNFDLKSLRTALSTIDVVVSTGYIVLTMENKLNPRFSRWLLQQFDVSHMKTLGSGVRQTINYNDIGNSLFCLPTPEEQRTIAAFLDYETARIDQLIAKQQQLIELLKEKRQAVISHAVKPRPNEKHVKISYVIDLLTGFPFPSSEFKQSGENIIRLLRGVNVGVDQVKWDDTVFWDSQDCDSLKGYHLQCGDIVFGMDRPWISNGARVAEISNDDMPCLLLQRVARIRANHLAYQSFIKLCLASNEFRAYVEADLTGVSVPHISPEQIKNFIIRDLCYEEQVSVTTDALNKLEKLRIIEQTALNAIELIQERRTALISAAVTGKIDLRGWQPPKSEVAA